MYNKQALKKAYQDAQKADIETTAEGRSFLHARYQFYNRKGSEKHMDMLGGRKFTFALLLTVCATIFVAIGKATTQEWLTFEAAVGATYVIGNIGDKLAQ